MNNPYAVPDADIVAAVEDAIADGETDDADGGAPAEAVAERLPIKQHTTEQRLRELVDEGQLKEVYGIGPTIPRKSYRVPD